MTYLNPSPLRVRLLSSTVIGGALALGLLGSPAWAQTDPAAADPADAPAEDQTADPAASTEVEGVVVTGSRIVRNDYVANSPMATVTGEQAVQNADITLETFLNNLPQVAPAATTTSNNPGNSGQANIDLRGLGFNRNLVLVDGRRPMVSGTSTSGNLLSVDVNTIPAALIQRIEVITGGAGAAYGADAISGVVNVILRDNFQGVDLLASTSNSLEFWDAKEYQLSAVIGGNFADGRGNAVLAFDRSVREPLVKSQRAFSAFATSSTTNPPQGAYSWNNNAPSEAAVDAVFAKYGVAANAVRAESQRFGFNRDGTLIFYGIANDPQYEVQNFRDPIDVTVNPRFYPDFYSYNFDAPNLLTLPLDRYSFLGKFRYEFDNDIEVFSQVGWTEYTAAQGLAPTPVPSVPTRPIGENTNTQVASNLINPGQVLTGSMVVPITNPFIPADLRTLLASRTGDDPVLVGSGATEPFRFAFRPTQFGLRQSTFENTVVQFLGGARVPLGERWELEAYVSEGRTETNNTQTGNVNTQRLTEVLADPTTGGGACATFNPFGTNVIPASCITYLSVPISSTTEFVQHVGQAFVRGDVAELAAGTLSVVFGAEHRNYDYSFTYQSAAGPISGFNVQPPEAATATYNDMFAEALIPLVRGMPFVRNLELNLGYRYSFSQFKNELTGVASEATGSSAYKADLNYEISDWLRTRLSYQRSVRAPNFSELFTGTNSFPQVFDPCSAGSAARQGRASQDPARLRALCIATGVPAATVDSFQATPNAQLQTNLSGNPDLAPETGRTISVGAVFSSPWRSPWLQRLRGSVDYFDIEVEDAILALDANVQIAACYNYYGTNPNYDANTFECRALRRAGGQFSGNLNPNNPNGNFLTSNGGFLGTKGVDLQLDWGFDWDWMGLPSWLGNVRANLLLTHIMSFERQDAPNLPVIEYAGTISYFGAGLGTSYPDWKANLTTTFTSGPFALDVRARYIAAMKNRQAAQYPGETSQTGVDSTWYFDVGAGYELTDNIELRLGVNNLLDTQPKLYAPNVQSGTDPSTYDIIGRRLFGQVRLRF